MNYDRHPFSGSPSQRPPPETKGGSEREAAEFVGPLSADGIALARNKGRYFFLDGKGHRTGAESYDWASGFQNGVAWVRNGRSEALIDSVGKVLTDIPIQDHWPFVEGIARTSSDGMFQFIRKDGSLLTTDKFDSASDFMNGRARVRFGGETYYLHSDGTLTSFND